MKNKTYLLSIDCQNDFCIANGPGGEKGSLVVAGADKDMDRLSKFITKNQRRIDEIHATLDSHQTIHVAHPIFWIDSKGNHPNPFTLITADDVRNGHWKTFNPKWQARGLSYVETLEKNKRYVLCIWPPHCLIGSWGHSLVPSVSNAFNEWEKDTFNKVNYTCKGSNLFSEHYSCVMADVVDNSDPSTKLNSNLIDVLQEADEILIAGEALSHCVASSIFDISSQFGDDNVKKFTLLEDCSSSVGGFEKLGIDFVNTMKKKGMKISNTRDW